MQNYCLVFLIEQRAALEELKRANLLLGDANPLRRSGVRARSILTAIDQRGFQVGQFLVARLDRAAFHHSGIER